MSNLIITLYILIVLATIVKIIFDTRNPIKSLGYILTVVFIPIIGIVIYFSIGINYRKQKFYKKKLIQDIALYQQVKQYIIEKSNEKQQTYAQLLEGSEHTVKMLLKDITSPLASVTETKLLINGESKFEEVFKELEKAKHHIHIQYYIFCDDQVGNRMKDLMIRKVREGVKVRFIFDDFGSYELHKKMLKELVESGVEVNAFYKVHLYALANRLNYRNHRKIIVIDGHTGFMGGINVEDKYINDEKNKLYWRDTHLMFKGIAVASLQFTFISDWNFCSENPIMIDRSYFPEIKEEKNAEELIQIVTSGPDSKNASIMMSCLGIITSSKKRLYITSPYFIPNDTIVDALKYAALSGVDVRLLVPGISDSKLVNGASCSYYGELLDSGVRIYRYQKGFVHAKTIVSDDKLSVIGSANMDIRSFDLNFEINALVFSPEINTQLSNAFFTDLNESIELNSNEWSKRSPFIQFGDSIARLLSPLL